MFLDRIALLSSTKKLVSYTLSFGLQDVVSWARRGSNTGPLDLQSNALPTAPQTLVTARCETV